MRIKDIATERIYFKRNDEASSELAILGFQMPPYLARVFKLVNDQRTFTELVNHPDIAGDDFNDEQIGKAIRSLIKIGLIVPLPVSETSQSSSAATQISATQRLKMITAATDTSVSDTQAIAAIGSTKTERIAWEGSLDAQSLANLKASLLLELRRVLGRDVDLVQMKIMSVNSADELMKSVGVCARILEAAISLETSQKFLEIFKKHFAG